MPGRPKAIKKVKKMAVFWVVTPCSLVEVSIIRAALIMEAAKTSETVNVCHTTRRNNPEDSHLHTRCRENLKSYKKIQLCPFVKLRAQFSQTLSLLSIERCPCT
jgi:hypothetical protein